MDFGATIERDAVTYYWVSTESGDGWMRMLRMPDWRQQHKGYPNKRDVPDERAEQGNARCIEQKINHPGRKIDASSPFTESALAAEHVDKQDRSRKNRKRLKEVSKCSFQTPRNTRERRDCGVTRARCPTITSLKAG